MQSCTTILRKLEKETGKKWSLIVDEGYVPKFLQWETAEDFVQQKICCWYELELDHVIVLDDYTVHYGVTATDTKNIYFASKEAKDEYLQMVDEHLKPELED